MRKALFSILSFILLTATANTAEATCFRSGETASDTNALTPIYRLYNTKTGVHLYTRGVSDAESVLHTFLDFEFTDSVPAFCASLTADTGLTPIYRLYNTSTGVHLYTRGEADRDSVLATWPEFEFTDGVPAFYATLTDAPELTPLYRLFNTKLGVHLYVRGKAERDYILQKWPEFEFTDGVPAFYAELATNLNPLPVGPSPLGSDIRVGIYSETRSGSQSDPFEVESTNHPYTVKREDGTVLANLSAGQVVEVEYDDDGKLKVDLPNAADAIIDDDVIFEATSISHRQSIVFDVHVPGSSYDDYRGRIRIHYDDNDKLVWLINELPLEQYVWGIGEITATGPEEYNRAMTTIFRTYGHYKVTESVEHKYKTFDTVPDASDQIYRGHVWETTYPRIREAAEATRGKMVFHDGTPILTPFGSWTDGRTRNYADGHFGGSCRADDGTTSSLFPYLIGVNDEWGEHPTHDTCTLASLGNHMVGISANGALNLADDHGWKWDQIIDHYLTDVSIQSQY